MNMTASAPLAPPTQHTPTLHSSRGISVNNRSNSNISHQENEKRELSSLLWHAFPEDSEHAVSKAAAPVLGKTDCQIRKYLRQEVAEPPGWMKYALKSIIAARKIGRRIEHVFFRVTALILRIIFGAIARRAKRACKRFRTRLEQ